MSAATTSAALKRKSSQVVLPVEALKRSRRAEEKSEDPSSHEQESLNNSSTSPTSNNSTHHHMNSNLRKKPMGAAAPTKKLVFKGFKVKPQLPDNFEEETWKKLREAIRAIHSHTSISYPLEELYQAVEALCSQKLAPSLYAKLHDECLEHVKSEGQKLLGQTGDSSAFLTLVDNAWQSHTNNLDLIRSIFLVLDRTYVIQTPNTRSIWEMGLGLFREQVVTIPEIENKTREGILSLIERDRRGETVNRTLLKSLLRMFGALGIYADRFEKQFFEATTDFYAQEGVAYMQESDIAEYLRHVEIRLHEENERVYHYLDASTKKTLISIVEKRLLENHISTILDKGFDLLVEGNNHQDLARMYQLLGRVNGWEALKNSWNTYIKRAGTSIVNDPERDKSMVQELLDFKSKLDFILEVSFNRNEGCSYALKEAFEHFINVRQNKPAELIAKFIDEKLRSGKGTSEEELETLLDKLMTLFRYIQGKDVFEAFYKKDLAKRLLLGKSASFDAEKSMIAKLKTECGSGFTNKLEGMFKDIDLSRDIMSSFKESAKHLSQLSHLPTIDLNVYVLTTGNWPAYTPMECKLPSEMAEYQEVFKTFYLSKHYGRRLMWQNSLGHCTLRCKFPSGPKEFFVSLFQTVVLMLFNDADTLSYRDIQAGTGIEEKELKRTLQSLACGKVRILTKKPKSRDVNDDDTFVFNREFTAKAFRIKVNSIQLKETPEENQKTNESIIQDRQYQVDAAIVRIMKTRKTLKHQLLISEICSQLKFPMKASELKKRIESLIDREYLERDTSDSQVYHYLA